MTYSFSRLNSYEQCPYQFYNKYIEESEGEENFYAQAGSLMHEILANVLNNEMSVEEATDYFVENFDLNCYMEIPERIRDSTFEKCINYLTAFDRIDESDLWKTLSPVKVIGVEEEVRFKIGEWDFIGFIDLLVEDKEGNLIVVDHKSTAYPVGKSGKILKSAEKTFLDHKRQEYLYSIAVKDKYGKYPTKLAWNHFKDGKTHVIDFDKKDLGEAVLWVTETINKINKDEGFLPNIEFFFCKNLCEFRSTCEYCGMSEDDLTDVLEVNN